MQTLTLRGSNSLIQQFAAQAKQLARKGEEIEVLENENFSPQGSWNDILQNEQVLQDIQESLAQIERGETYEADEAFDLVFKRLGL